jgi:hypothetical protein
MLAAHDVPSDQKKAAACRGVVLFEDEASFWLDGTLHRTWARVGCQPRVDTYGMRKTGHLFATIGLFNADFTYWFADVFNGDTFWTFLKRLVTKYDGRKIFLVIDNAPLPQPSARFQAPTFRKPRPGLILARRSPSPPPAGHGLRGAASHKPWPTSAAALGVAAARMGRRSRVPGAPAWSLDAPPPCPAVYSPI